MDNKGNGVEALGKKRKATESEVNEAMAGRRLDGDVWKNRSDWRERESAIMMTC